MSSRVTKPMPPAAWNWFTSASPFGYTRASSGVTREMSAMSSQVMVRPQARAMATRWMTWLVEPPVAIRPTMALTKERSSTTSTNGR